MTLGGRCLLCGTGILVAHQGSHGPSGWLMCPAAACCAWFDVRQRRAYLKDFVPVPWPEPA